MRANCFWDFTFSRTCWWNDDERLLGDVLEVIWGRRGRRVWERNALVEINLHFSLTFQLFYLIKRRRNLPLSLKLPLLSVTTTKSWSTLVLLCFHPASSFRFRALFPVHNLSEFFPSFCPLDWTGWLKDRSHTCTEWYPRWISSQQLMYAFWSSDNSSLTRDQWVKDGKCQCVMAGWKDEVGDHEDCRKSWEDRSEGIISPFMLSLCITTRCFYFSLLVYDNVSCEFTKFQSFHTL